MRGSPRGPCARPLLRTLAPRRSDDDHPHRTAELHSLRVVAAAMTSLYDREVRRSLKGKCGGPGAECPTPVEAQLESFQTLALGYDDSSIAWLGKLLTWLLDAFALPRPYLYATTDGGARAEWSAPHWEVSVEFDLRRHLAEALAARVDTDELHETSEVLAEPGAESRLGLFLAKYVASRQ